MPAYAPSPYAAPGSGYYAIQPSHDELQSLRQQYARLATKRAERMDGPELIQGIADMRQHFLIAELTAFARESQDDFDKLQAVFAADVLKAKDKQELKKLVGTWSKEMFPDDDVRYITPQGFFGTLMGENLQHPSYLFVVTRLLMP
jgi:hypothetical protein